MFDERERKLFKKAMEYVAEDVGTSADWNVMDKILDKAEERKGRLYELLQENIRVSCGDIKLDTDEEEKSLEDNDEEIKPIMKDKVMSVFARVDIEIRDSSFMTTLQNLLGPRAIERMASESSSSGETRLVYNPERDVVEAHTHYSIRLPALLLAIIDFTPAHYLTQNKLESGMKVNKFVKTILPPEIHEQFDINWSKVMQEVKTQKTNSDVIISIAPIDYIFQSEASRWSSCHKIFGLEGQPGEKGNAGYSMLMDQVTLVAYKQKNDTFNRCGITYPDKSWRQLIHVDFANQSIQFGRQYPSPNASASKAVRYKMNHLLSEHLHSERRKWIKRTGSAEIRTAIYPYDDLGHGSRSASYTILKTGNSTPPDLRYGDRIMCIDCGKEDDCTEIPMEIPVCRRCGGRSDEDETSCEFCGDVFHIENMMNVNGEIMCEECYSEHFFECEVCSSLNDRDYMMIAFQDTGMEVVVGECCIDRFGRCEVCDEHYETLVEAEDKCGNIDICEECCENNAIPCEECGFPVMEDIIEDHRNGHALCLDCYDEEKHEEEAV